MGSSQAAFMTISHTMIQSIVPDGVRGRVAGIYTVHVGGMMAAGNLVNGLLADYIDAAMVLMYAGLAFVVVMVVSLQWSYLRGIYRRGLAVELASAEAAAGTGSGD